MVLFINVILFSTSSANSFKIKDLEISEPFNISFNKEKVINKGFKEAFKELVSMITTSSDQEKIKNISTKEVKSLIDSFNMGVKKDL